MSGGTKAAADDELASLIAGGMPANQAATMAGVSKATANRRMADPTFRAKVEQLRAQRLDAAAGTFNAMMATAAHAVHKALVHDDPEVALRAAKVNLDIALRLRELTGLEKEVRRLSEAVEQLQHERRPPCGLRFIPAANGEGSTS